MFSLHPPIYFPQPFLILNSLYIYIHTHIYLDYLYQTKHSISSKEPRGPYIVPSSQLYASVCKPTDRKYPGLKYSRDGFTGNVGGCTQTYRLDRRN